MINFLFPLINIIDSGLALLLPFTIRIFLWGLISGGCAMAIYKITSNQPAITNIKKEIKDLRRKMMKSSMENSSEYNTLAKNNLFTSIELLKKVTLPAFLSILPVLIFAIWAETFHSYELPENKISISLHTIPTEANIDILPSASKSYDIENNLLIHSPNSSGNITILINDQIIYSNDIFSVPAPVIKKKKWWNVFIKNEIGYIDSEAAISEIRLGFSKKHLFPGLPKWLAGWELLFFTGVFIITLTLRFVYKIK